MASRCGVVGIYSKIGEVNIRMQFYAARLILSASHFNNSNNDKDHDNDGVEEDDIYT